MGSRSDPRRDPVLVTLGTMRHRVAPGGRRHFGIGLLAVQAREALAEGSADADTRVDHIPCLDRVYFWRCAMSALLVGYARCSTDQQDLTAQRDGLLSLGVEPDRIYVDHGLTGTNRERPGLREALAACRAGDTLVVTKLDRLARSLPDARAIADELTVRQVSLSLGGSVYDPTDAVGKLLFNVLAMVAEFESDLIRLRTVEGMKVAKAKGRLRGKQPKLSRKQEAHLVSLVHSGEYSTLEVAELFGVGRSTVYRAIDRQRIAAKADLAEARSRH